jgi:hypothetical protein
VSYRFAVIEYEPWDVVRPLVGDGTDRMVTNFTATPAGELSKRSGRRWSPGDVEGLQGGDARAVELNIDERCEVTWMQAIPHLMPMSSKTNVVQRLPVGPLSNPPCENPLIGSTKLATAGEDSAAVHKDRDPGIGGIFPSERFAGNFGGTIQGKWRIGAKGLPDPEVGQTLRVIRLRDRRKSVVERRERYRGQGSYLREQRQHYFWRQTRGY